MTLIIGAGVIAAFTTLFGTRVFISFLRNRGYGQFVRDDGPDTHSEKRGTPTMGGIVIIASVILGYVIAHLLTWQPPSVSGVLLLLLMAASGALGFLDDWTKIRKRRSLGLTSRAKLVGQLLIGVLFGLAALSFPNGYGVTPGSTAISFTRDIDWLRLPLIVAVVWMTLIIIGSSNAVNLTDGLDGLASGALAIVFGSFALISFWQRNQWCQLGSSGPRCYPVRDPWDVAVVAAALAAACFAFLWWNAKPANIFLGDTGSLALGAVAGGLAIITRTELLLVILGFLFVIETLSVIIQVTFFKLTKGKRVFKMTPLHHHFELLGWQEVTVVIRFWIIAGMSATVALAIFYGEWVIGQ